MASSRGRRLAGPHVTSVAQITPRQRGRIVWIGAVFLLAFAATAAAGDTGTGRAILSAVQRFMLFYAGVFALIALTATVGIGLAATDRIVMVPSTRVVAQAVHRAVSLAALAFLVIHIVTEILAQRAGVIDALIPFLGRRRTFYIGLGTIASDLLVLLIVTGLARSRFAGTRPATWRIIHASAYLCWLFSILHGLLGGRAAKPYVDWSYGGCVAAVLLALTIRTVASVRDQRETAPQAVPGRPAAPVPAAVSAMAALGLAGRAPGMQAMPGVRGMARPARALPAGHGDGPGSPDPQQAWAHDPYPDPYAAQPYAGDYYDARPGRGPELWPDHPSAPMPIPGLHQPPSYPPSAGADRL